MRLFLLLMMVLCGNVYAKTEDPTSLVQPVSAYGTYNGGILPLKVDSTGALSVSGGVTPTSSYIDQSQVYNVKNITYGAKGDGVHLTDGAITNGTANFTSATAVFTSADVGKVMWIFGAGGSNLDLVTTISAFVSSTAVTLTDNALATVSSAPFIYGTDDTTAIQTAINAIGTAGYGTLYFPAAIYIVNGAYQNAAAENSQLTLPSVLTTAKTVYIKFKGDRSNFINFAPPPTTITQGTTIFSTKIGSSGTQSLLSGYNNTNALKFTNITLALEDLNFLFVQNVIESGLNLFTVPQATGKNVNIQTALYSWPSTVAPTGTTSVGLKQVRVSGNVLNYWDNLTITGFYIGTVLGEHFTGLNNTFRSCYYAIYNDTSGHSKIFYHVSLEKNYTHFYFTAADFSIQIYDADFEDDTGGGHWYSTAYNVDDSSNHAYGDMWWEEATTGGSGYDHSIPTNGASHLQLHEITSTDGQYSGWGLKSGTTIKTIPGIGNVGIGTTTDPTSKLYVWGNGQNNTSASLNVINAVTGGSTAAVITATNNSGFQIGMNMGASTHGAWPNTGTLGTTGSGAPLRLYTDGNVQNGGTDGINIAPGGYLEKSAMNILPTGNVGIGTTDVTPTASLEITKNGTNDLLQISSTDANNGDLLTMKSGGNVGIGSTAPGVTFDVQGTIRASTGTGGQATCWKADKSLGQCTSVVGAGGACTCT